MGRIRGHYEWDDDDLTPGQQREGGLHQNLFDADGNLKGSARFIPDDETDTEPLVVTETVYVPVEQRTPYPGAGRVRGGDRRAGLPPDRPRHRSSQAQGRAMVAGDGAAGH